MNETKEQQKQFYPTAGSLLRVKQILGDPDAKPPIPAILPVSKSTFWAKVKTGEFPQPVRLAGVRITAWKASEIYALAAGEWKKGGKS